jgi:hypothetical protein
MHRFAALLSALCLLLPTAFSCQKPPAQNAYRQAVLDSTFLALKNFHEKMQAHNAMLKHKRDSLRALPGLVGLNQEMRQSFMNDLDSIYTDNARRLERHANMMRGYQGVVLSSVRINDAQDSSLADLHRKFMESQGKFEKGQVRDEKRFADMQRQLTDVLSGKRR